MVRHNWSVDRGYFTNSELYYKYYSYSIQIQMYILKAFDYFLMYDYSSSITQKYLLDV